MLESVDVAALTEMAAAKKTTADGLKSIALGVGAGLGTIGPGIGVAVTLATASNDVPSELKARTR